MDLQAKYSNIWLQKCDFFENKKILTQNGYQLES
jgi:hypothetical protein